MFYTQHPIYSFTFRVSPRSETRQLTAVHVAGDGGMGDEEVVEVGVLLEWRYNSSSTLP